MYFFKCKHLTFYTKTKTSLKNWVLYVDTWKHLVRFATLRYQLAAIFIFIFIQWNFKKGCICFAGWRGQAASSLAARAPAATTRTPWKRRPHRRRPQPPTPPSLRRCRPPPRFRTGPRCRRRPSSPPRPVCPTFRSSYTDSMPGQVSPAARRCSVVSPDFFQVRILGFFQYLH